MDDGWIERREEKSGEKKELLMEGCMEKGRKKKINILHINLMLQMIHFLLNEDNYL